MITKIKITSITGGPFTQVSLKRGEACYCSVMALHDDGHAENVSDAARFLVGDARRASIRPEPALGGFAIVPGERAGTTTVAAFHEGASDVVRVRVRR